MKDTFLKVMPWVFEEEGGYVDHPKDPGGATNLGITFRTLQAWRKKKITKQDVKNLSKQEATQIYRSEYWNSIKGDRLPSGLDYAVLDYGINSGPSRAVKSLQKIVGVSQDGIIGAQTLSAVSKISVTKLIDLYQNERLRFLKSLKTWGTFGKGWQNRVERVRKRSKSLVGDPTSVGPKASPEPSMEEIEPIQSPKAREEDTSVKEVLKKPSMWAPILGGLSGFGSLLSGTGPIQWVLAVGLLIGILYGAYYLVKKERRDA